MPNRRHLAILKKGVTDWNQWREQKWRIRPNVNKADLTNGYFRHAQFVECDLREAVFFGTDLRDANFEGANLEGADFCKAVLRRANLCRANLERATFFDAVLAGADLSEADLRSAQLKDANFTNARLFGANFDQAFISDTVFGNVDLSNTKGLNSCIHAGPSIVDHRTLAKSPNLPLAFLRGCGVPEPLIEYLPSLLHRSIQFYSCFISYSTKDQALAERLHADLQNKGVRCWFASHSIKAGKKLHSQIDEAIRLYDRLLLILSEDSMNSEWVKTEIAHARQKELREKRQVLFPITVVPFSSIREWECFDGDTGKDSAREIREYFIPDFSNWKDHDAYQRAFARLVRDLRLEENASPDAPNRP